MMTPGTTRRHFIFGLPAAAAAVALSPRAIAAPVVEPAAAKLIASAEAQIGVTTLYDASYQRLTFPGGDVAADRGVCTDVVVRAYRVAFGFDLQQRLNADMRAHGSVYPRRWGLTRPDPNIDHRRVPNLQTFFTRLGAERPRPATEAEWQPGDLVTLMVPVGRPHIGIISATPNAGGTRLMLVHNIGRGTQVEDVLDQFPVTGRYRFLP